MHDFFKRIADKFFNITKTVKVMVAEVDVNNTDLIIINTNKCLSEASKDSIEQYVKNKFTDKNQRALILDEGMTITIVHR